ncbi:MAG: hypothetical protein JO061_19905, partial [Acidobacteriaceae bacterium]|nr:hypothetical protein [Acidobacteriaceae bacterium]
MSTKPVRAFSKAAANGPNLADEGLLLVDTRLEAIAVDEGATWILNDERTGGDGADVRLTLPGEIRDLLSSMKTTDLPTAKVHFHVGNATYSCRVFLLRRPDGTDPQP